MLKGHTPERRPNDKTEFVAPNTEQKSGDPAAVKPNAVTNTGSPKVVATNAKGGKSPAERSGVRTVTAPPDAYSGQKAPSDSMTSADMIHSPTAR